MREKAIEIVMSGNINNEFKPIIESLGFSYFKKKNMLGGESELVLIGSISTALIASVTKVVLELIRSNRSAELEINGVKVKGVSEKTVNKVIEQVVQGD